MEQDRSGHRGHGQLRHEMRRHRHGYKAAPAQAEHHDDPSIEQRQHSRQSGFMDGEDQEQESKLVWRNVA